ncbi:rhamnogalacturonan acetylesterase, partial [Streptomyces sp. TRM76130]|nr:rhamnogalacturonan acetylesterase [Streptomyces sp. TRM76130]
MSVSRRQLTSAALAAVPLSLAATGTAQAARGRRTLH